MSLAERRSSDPENAKRPDADDPTSRSSEPLNETAWLEALASLEFTTDVRGQTIWTDSPYDVPEIYPSIRAEFRAKLLTLRQHHEAGQSYQPRGWPLAGPAGVGKTHLFSVFRRIAAEEGAAFLFVDMTGVRDFWKTVLEGILGSLQMPYKGGAIQHRALTERLLVRLGARGDDLARQLPKVYGVAAAQLPRRSAKLIAYLRERDRANALKHQDVVRALVALACPTTSVQTDAYAWLEGVELSPEAAQVIGLSELQREPHRIVEGLGWFLGLGGPTVIVFDQLDGIIQRSRAILSGRTPSDLASLPVPEEDDTSLTAHRELQAAVSIVQALATGLMELRNLLDGTLVVVGCQDTSWELVEKLALDAAIQRFDTRTRFTPNQGSVARRQLIATRLAPVYHKTGLVPPYPTFPFTDAWLTSQSDSLPRELLLAAERHRRACVERGRLTELTPERTEPAPTTARPDRTRSSELPPSDPTPPAHPAVPPGHETASDSDAPSGHQTEPIARPTDRPETDLAARWTQLRQATDSSSVLAEDDESEPWVALLTWALEQVVDEARSALPATHDVRLAALTGGTKTCGLHGRIETIPLDRPDDAQHDCVRILEHRNARAFIGRLEAALTTSGIDQNLSFRHLTLLRSTAPPSGSKTAQTVAQATRRGATFCSPDPGDVAALMALQRLSQAEPVAFRSWARASRPTLGLGLIRTIAPHLMALVDGGLADQTGQDDTAANAAHSAAADAHVSSSQPPVEMPPAEMANVPPDGLPSGAATTTSSDTATSSGMATASVATSPGPVPEERTDALPRTIELGRRIRFGSTLGDPVPYGVEQFAKHTLVIGGAGAGKTVTLRRLVEEAALRGIPSIVIDAAGDLDRFGQVRATVPPGWGPNDPALATRFHRTVEQVVFTPGQGANSLTLEPVPDLTDLVSDPDEEAHAVELITGNIASLVVRGTAQADEQRAVIQGAVQCLIRFNPGGGLAGLIDILQANPDEMGPGLSNQAALATKLANALIAARSTNPLLREGGTPLDPDRLFGFAREDGDVSQRTRIAVISLSNLHDDGQRIAFVAQLATTLFAWLRRRHRPTGAVIRALLVLDEAKDMMPSSRQVASSRPLVRLVAQGRKYGLGLILATQGPRELHSNAVNSCSTRIYGRQNSTQDIQTVKKLIEETGGSAPDVAALRQGQFYVYNADIGLSQATKIAMPNSLSDGDTPAAETA